MSAKLNDYKKNKTDDNEKDHLTFFMAEYYHNILFKPFCSYMDSLPKKREFCKFILSHNCSHNYNFTVLCVNYDFIFNYF